MYLGSFGVHEECHGPRISWQESERNPKRRRREDMSLPSEVDAARVHLSNTSADWYQGIDRLQPRSGTHWKGLNVAAKNEKPKVHEVPAAVTSTTFGVTLFEPVIDNTEGIAGVEDLKIPPNTNLLVDVGGGEFDAVKTWLEGNRGVQEVLVMDPFTRTTKHNQDVQQRIIGAHGADVVTSISVLNVIPELSNRVRHLVLVYHILKEGGIGFFKVWPGMWPERGWGQATSDGARGVWQANKWVTEFVPEVEAVFGADNVRCDANRNLLVAHKAREATRPGNPKYLLPECCPRAFEEAD